MASDVIQIVNGPSKFTLGVKFLDRYDEITGRLKDDQFVTFITNLVTSTGPGGVALAAKVYLTGLSYESGNDHSWLFEGRLAGTQLCWGSDVDKVKGYYNSKTHQGTISPA